MSSAYIWVSTSGHTSGRSFTYKLNNRGPKIEPCGTPTEQPMKDEVLPTLVHCFFSSSECWVIPRKKAADTGSLLTHFICLALGLLSMKQMERNCIISRVE